MSEGRHAGGICGGRVASWGQPVLWVTEAGWLLKRSEKGSSVWGASGRSAQPVRRGRVQCSLRRRALPEAPSLPAVCGLCPFLCPSVPVLCGSRRKVRMLGLSSWPGAEDLGCLLSATGFKVWDGLSGERP